VVKGPRVRAGQLGASANRCAEPGFQRSSFCNPRAERARQRAQHGGAPFLRPRPLEVKPLGAFSSACQVGTAPIDDNWADEPFPGDELRVRALQLVELIGPDAVRVADVPEPSSDGGVLVEVRAAGLSFPDLLRSRGQYQERQAPPYTIGGEFAGIVLTAPDGSGYAPGDRVAGTAVGAAAERARADLASLIRLPESLTFGQGAALPLNYRTAILGLEIRGRLQPGEIVLVHGAAGGTGTAAIQVARASDCRVIGVVSTDAKAHAALDAGAHDVLRSDGPWKDEALRLTEGRGVDLVWDPVGGDRVLDTMRVLAPFGRWVVLGFTGGPIPNVPLNRVLLRNIDVVGSYIGGYLARFPERTAALNVRLQVLVDRAFARPVVGMEYTLEEGAAALREIENRGAIGKVVIRVTEASD
jgi:NADPH:quinone reductase